MTEHFSWQQFGDFSPATLYAALKLRSEVFVVEQNCVFLDLDDHDQNALHLLMHDNHGELMGYARVLPPGEKYPECSIGRVVIGLKHRNTGTGARLMAEALRGTRENHPHTPILLWAQQRLEGFYARYGFVTVSEPELEDGILHVRMRLPE